MNVNHGAKIVAITVIYALVLKTTIVISLNVASEKTHKRVRCGALNIVETQ